MLNPLAGLPASWFTEAVVIRGGGRDGKGEVIPSERIKIERFLVGARSTSEPTDRSELTANKAVGYHETFEFRSTDRIEIPQGSRMAGTWAVEGRPAQWPWGWEVGLT